MNNYGFRINKYVKISFVIGMFDVIIFYISGKLFNYMDVFDLIINNWKYNIIFFSTFLLAIYFIDLLFFYKRNTKYKLMLIFKEPFSDWVNYVSNCGCIDKKTLKCNFYKDIYHKVKDKDKIKGIMEDEIAIRDIGVHLLTTNNFIIIFFFLIEKFNLLFCIYSLSLCLTLYLLFVILYRNYLKYFISEIYKEYIIEKNKSKL